MAGRNTTTRDRHRTIIARDQPPCGICGKPIDYTITDHLDPRAFVVDHITPWVISQDDTLDNKQAAHRACNRTKSDKTTPTADGAELRTHTTPRRWWTD